MVRLSNKARKSKNKGADGSEETAGLVPRSPGALAEAAAAANAGSGYNRYWHLLWIVLIGCLALYIWDEMEWDDEKSIGVQLKNNTEQSIGQEDDDILAKKMVDVDNDKTKMEKLSNDQQDGEPAVTTTTPATPDVVTTETPKPPPPQPPPETTTTEAPKLPPPPPPPPQQLSGATGQNAEECQQQCIASSSGSRFDGIDLTVVANMRTRLQTFRQQWIDSYMKPQYGDYYENIFEPIDKKTNTRIHIGNQRAFKSPNNLNVPHVTSKPSEPIGWNRMKRKYQMKLLQVQLGMMEQQLDATSYCQQYLCAPPTEGHAMKSSQHYAKFLWVNGGHSASAGHGNFYPESYTANLGRDVGPILSQIGLDFQVKNYAMGGTESGEEVALCHNSIFGKDIDSLSWDYGMTDGHEHNKITLYAYRTARLSQLDDSFSQPGNIKHRPSLIGIHHNDDVTEAMFTMQELGMTVLGMDWPFERNEIEGAFPDMFGMSDEQINGLAPSVQYFKCEGKVESGEPGCQAHKYNETMCPKRKAKASWHPGKKYHALVGHMLAYTVLEVFDQALEEMAKTEPATPETPEAKKARLQQQLNALNVEEQTDYDRIFSSPVPDKVLSWFDNWQWKGDKKDIDKGQMKPHLNMDWLIKDPVFCHTAMLPAEIRYRGLLTENLELAGTVLDEHWEHATMQSKIVESESPNPTSGRQVEVFKDPRPNRENVMVLAAKDDERDRCDAMTNADVKDYFYVSGVEDWRVLNIPNDASKAYYAEFDATKSRGWIFVCMAKCDWGRCPTGDIRKQVMEFSSDPGFGGITMEVNLVQVTSLNCMNSCCALKHDDPDPGNQFIWKANPEGRYTFRAKINPGREYGYARFSSFILL